MKSIEASVQTIPEAESPAPKPKQIRKKRAPERYLADGTYNVKPLSPTYQKDYYAKKKADSPCEYCHVICSHPYRLKEHLRVSKRCNKLRESLQELREPMTPPATV